jgi:mRNA-degrading endonuclease RelE of RelBE toxin-antitoxin system
MYNANYKRPFTQFVKKQSRALQASIEDEVKLICENPDIGELKKGDLSDIQVHKFKFNRQEYLIAYSVSDTIQILMIDFYKVGTHENFYTELKKYLQRE